MIAISYNIFFYYNPSSDQLATLPREYTNKHTHIRTHATTIITTTIQTTTETRRAS